MSRGSTPERAILAGLMAPRPSGELIALDSVVLVEQQRSRGERVIEVTYRAVDPQRRPQPRETEHTMTYRVVEAEDGGWETREPTDE